MTLRTVHKDYISTPNEFIEQIHILENLISSNSNKELSYNIFSWNSKFYGSWFYGFSEKTGKYILDESLWNLWKSNQLSQDIVANIADSILDTNPLKPFDYSASLLESLAKMALAEPSFQKNLLNKLNAKLVSLSPKVNRVRHTQEPLSDGIDHLFPIPADFSDRISLVREAAQIFSDSNMFLIVNRALSFLEGKPILDQREFLEDWKGESFYTNPNLEQAIKNQITDGCLLNWTRDYLVFWDRQATYQSGFNLTLGEILRMVLLDGGFHMPDIQLRPIVLGFLRACLKIQGGAIVGLKSGVFHVEHGASNIPSYFFMGREAVLGKGLLIDGIGGIAIGSKAFLGGGFMPILIHTHKHLKPTTGMATDERTRILPVGIEVCSGARFPMKNPGIFEAADFLQESNETRALRDQGFKIHGLTLEQFSKTYPSPLRADLNV